ncbi:uncharacterized protein LOC115745353 isoform X2 [Rhodamnia argentea]|uniref:Uncharacterized protein LOC115745353 isoform X2 n=1 Tax=Rhodamnia argentea TaxID=178133 RepID=A0A8B8PPM2_9MYRT|nr:uncharacterized protein LOC115745353 isoform X2 [Rhodamnia argentea]
MDDATKLNKDDVIARLKDDGDFDRLRLKLIRNLKDNEELRSKIIATVKQSAALNRSGAENLKPRQLSDAIYEEVGKVMGQISESLWEIIRSADGMKSEIEDTVQYMCSKLLNPSGKDMQTPMQRMDYSRSYAVPSGETSAVSNNERKKPLGFCLTSNNQNDGEQNNERVQVTVSHERGFSEGLRNEQNPSHKVLTPNNVDVGIPPGFSADGENRKLFNDTEDDPELPPGFG